MSRGTHRAENGCQRCGSYLQAPPGTCAVCELPEGAREADTFIVTGGEPVVKKVWLHGCALRGGQVVTDESGDPKPCACGMSPPT